MTAPRTLRVVPAEPPHSAFTAYVTLDMDVRSKAAAIAALAVQFRALDTMATAKSVQRARDAIPQLERLLAELRKVLP